MNELNQKILEELRFLTFPNSFGNNYFFEENDQRYEKYYSLIENNKLSLNDIILIRDILLLTNYEVEDFLIDLFVSKNNGSLTMPVKGEFISNFPDLFMKIGDINKKLAPIIFFDKEGLNEFDINKVYYCGFHKYIKSAVLLRENLKERFKENQNNYINVDTEKYSNAINIAIENMEHKPCLEQKVAIATSMINKSFCVISGGPGTGKTTVIFSLLNSLYQLNNSLTYNDIVLLAPTGRAAGRIEESVKEAAEKLNKKFPSDFLNDLVKIKGSTIHKYLKNNIDLKEKQNKKTDKIVIVDEVSMVDIYVMSALLNNIDVRTRLVLVGDYNQLPSVDAGCVMADLSIGRENTQVLDLVSKILNINKDSFNNSKICYETSKAPLEYVSDLKINHRANVPQLKEAFIEIENENALDRVQITEELPFKNGAFILENTNILFKSNLVQDFLKYEFFEVDKDLEKSYIDFIKDIIDKDKIDFNKNIFEKDSSEYELFERLFSHINKYRILCPLRNSLLGCKTINRKFLREFRNRTICNDDFALGQPIMVIKNDYKLNVSNGDNGIALCDKNGIYKVVFKIKDKYVTYLATNFEYFEEAFAITVHKSQGCEYNNVLIPIEEYSDFITKELLYTALTRAKNSFVLMSDKNTIKQICKNKIDRKNEFKLY